MEQLMVEAEDLVLTSYKSEYQKIDQIAGILIHMINEYKENLQSKLTAGLVSERNGINEHIKAIHDLKT